MERLPRVLLAEDSRLALAIEKSFFETHGFTVLAAENGVGALELAASDLADVAILDYMLPDLTGAEICARLKARPVTRQMPVIIVSATETEEIEEACQIAGVDRIVPKSAGREPLLDVICELLNLPRRRDARIKVVFNVQDGHSKETIGNAADLSEGGLCLEVNRPYPMGSDLMLRFRLPGDREEVKAGARVCWTREREDGTHVMGVQFDEIAETDRLRVADYVEKTLRNLEATIA